MPRFNRKGFLNRLLFAFVALLAGDVAMLLVRPEPYSTLAIYAVFSLFGWMVVAIPISLVPPDIVSNLPSPLWALVGVALGPLALAVVILLLSRGHVEGFARTGFFFPISIIVSTVAAIMYQLLLRMWR